MQVITKKSRRCQPANEDLNTRGMRLDYADLKCPSEHSGQCLPETGGTKVWLIPLHGIMEACLDKPDCPRNTPPKLLLTSHDGARSSTAASTPRDGQEKTL